MKRLLSVSGFTALLTLLKMSSGFLIAKFVAIYTGPSGIAMLGQVQNMVGIFNGIINAPAGSGIVRFTAENIDAGYDKCAPWWKASLQWIVTLLFLVIPIGCFFSSQLSSWLFESREYYWLIILTCLSLPFGVANTLLISVINGQQQYKRYVILGMLSTVISTIIMILLIYLDNLKGALIATSINYSIAGILMLITSFKQPWFKFKYWLGSTSNENKIKIGSYALMGLTSAIVVPLSLILVRNILVSHVGWDESGQWQAVWKISEVYLSIITISLGTYFLPRLSSINDINDINIEIQKTVKIIIPLVIIMACVIYGLRGFIVNILFTKEFVAAKELFAIQLVGDVIKIFSWLYSYPLLSLGKTKLYIFSEVFFSFLFVILSYFFIINYGIKGVTYSYLCNYSFYLLFVLYISKKNYYEK